MSNSHEAFSQRLKNSLLPVQLVATWLQQKLALVKINPTQLSPDTESRYEYTDEGDIEIRLRVEVKQSSLPFTSAEDYKYDMIMVDEAYKINKVPKLQLWGYVILNKQQTHCVLVKAETRYLWESEEKKDRQKNRWGTFVMCPKEQGEFYNFNPNMRPDKEGAN